MSMSLFAAGGKAANKFYFKNLFIIVSLMHLAFVYFLKYNQ